MRTMFKIFMVLAAIFLLADPAFAETPGGVSGSDSSSDIWRDIRHGAQGLSSLPDKDKGYLILDKGQSWRDFRNGPVSLYGAIAIVGMVAAMLAFYLIRGQIKLDGPRTGVRIFRFSVLERANHWVMAGTFILLALTGLNLLYGKAVLLPVFGPELFSTFSEAGKFVHNWVAYPFALSLLITIVLWTKDNVLDKYDIPWILKAGGLFGGHSHPASARFNFGEKTMFWMVALGGLAVTFTGASLLFPGLIWATNDLQLMQIIHSITALVMTTGIIGHIYIATVGMEDAMDGMMTGYVDETWAKEHHSAWYEDHKGEGGKPSAPSASTPSATPAE